MKDRPVISVIVPTFNRASLLRHCIDSLLSQTLPPHQILIVDDGSGDHTPDVIDSYGSAVTSIGMENAGKSAAVNRGLEEVDGEFVWVLDDDDVALPDALERLVAPLTESDELGFSYATKFLCDSGPDGVITKVTHESRVPEQYDRLFVLRLLKNCFLGGASMLVRRSVYEAVGEYEVALVRSQDYEMAIRIALRFRGTRVVGGPTYYHRRHEGLRGSLADRFSSDRRIEKWQEYNQSFIRRLCNELPLDTFSPIEDEELRHSRGDLLSALERTAVRTAHGLWIDVARDITLLAEGVFDGQVTREERSVAEEIGRRLGRAQMRPPELGQHLRHADPRMVPILASIRRHLRLSSIWHALPRSIRSCLRFARSTVVTAAPEA
jgi:glycosyltransferase involved in cell wall biosynthesis